LQSLKRTSQLKLMVCIKIESTECCTHSGWISSHSGQTNRSLTALYTGWPALNTCITHNLLLEGILMNDLSLLSPSPCYPCTSYALTPASSTQTFHSATTAIIPSLHFHLFHYYYSIHYYSHFHSHFLLSTILSLNFSYF
jgi:hypothetical protein